MIDNEFMSLVKKRCSVRKFLPERISRDKLDFILEAGRLAPTAKNMQPLKFYILESESALEKINRVSPCIYGAKTVLMLCGVADDCWISPAGHHSFEMDVSIAATHMTLAAASVDVGSCWVCLFDPELAVKEFNLPVNIRPCCLMPLGYADDMPSDRHTTRKDIADITEFI